MRYQLKPGQESFEVVDGSFAGKKYEKGNLYDVIPDHEARRFEAVKPPPVEPKTAMPLESIPTWDGEPAVEEKPKKGVKKDA
jgi:hypothetical protein